jgi:hypothetical protein
LDDTLVIATILIESTKFAMLGTIGRIVEGASPVELVFRAREAMRVKRLFMRHGAASENLWVGSVALDCERARMF